jgi:heme-degrading monooxygenase HmoA
MNKRLIFSIVMVGFAFLAGYLFGTGSTHPVARVWHGVTSESNKDSYFEYLRDTGIPGLTKTKGNLGVYLLRRVESGKADFLVISLWDSIDSQKAYAGAQVSKAVVLPKDKQFLTEVEPTVNNYEILYSSLK